MAETTRVVIIGGGVGGTAIAYALVRLGWTDVVLLERSELTSGSTFHSAGLVGQLRGSPTLTRMMVDSVAIYRGLAAETGVGVNTLLARKHRTFEERLAADRAEARGAAAD